MFQEQQPQPRQPRQQQHQSNPDRKCDSHSFWSRNRRHEAPLDQGHSRQLEFFFLQFFRNHHQFYKKKLILNTVTAKTQSKLLFFMEQVKEVCPQKHRNSKFMWEGGGSQRILENFEFKLTNVSCSIFVYKFFKSVLFLTVYILTKVVR